MATSPKSRITLLVRCLHKALESASIPKSVARWSADGRSVLVFAEKDFAELAVSIWYQAFISNQSEGFGLPQFRETLISTGFKRKRSVHGRYTELSHPLFFRGNSEMALTVTEVPHEEQDKNWDMSDDLKSTDILTGTLRLQPPQICSFSESSVLPSAESAAVRVNLGLGFPEEPVDIYVVLDASWIALNVASADVLDGVKQDVSVYRASVEAIARIIRRTRNICDRITVLMANSLPFGEQSSMQKEQERAELATKLLAFKPGVAKTVATNVEARRFDANLGLKRLKNVLKKGVGKGPRQQPAVFMLVSDRSPNLSLDAPLPCPVHVICLPGESSGPLPAGKPETPISWVSKASGGTYSNLQSTQLPRDLIAQIISRMTKVISQSRQNSCAKPQIAFRGINGAKIMSISPLHKAPVFSPDPDQMVPHEVGDNPSDADCVESKVVPDVGIQIKEPPRRSGSSGKSAETVDETWMASFATHKLEMEATSNKMMFVVLLQIPRCDLQMVKQERKRESDESELNDAKRRAVGSAHAVAPTSTEPRNAVLSDLLAVPHRGSEEGGAVLPYLFVSLECTTRESIPVKKTKHWLCGRVYRSNSSLGLGSTN